MIPSVADGIYKYSLYHFIFMHGQALGPWTIEALELGIGLVPHSDYRFLNSVLTVPVSLVH
jgi:hypothetical protein